MEKTLTEVCEYLNNYFWRTKRNGTFVISGGTIATDYLQNGQYFRIVGSVFNDGVHKYPATNLIDETFDGAIWSMAVPTTVIDLIPEIDSWIDKYGSVDSEAMSPFTSESFGNYSYSKSAGSSADSSAGLGGWQSAFASRLNKWRRLRNMP